MISIPNSYLEDEIRDGFYIPSITKRTWAMELTVLDLIDEICRKHDIKYFADWGTYLGAVRHGGFIPWDDDLDICMHRNEFERFKAAAETELPEGYSIMSFHNNDYSWKFIANVVPNDHMCFEGEYLKSHYAFPYIVAIDIFIIDNISDNTDLEAERSEQIKKILTVADLLDTYIDKGVKMISDNISSETHNSKSAEEISKEINNAINYAENLTGIRIDRTLPLIEIKRALYSKVEKLLKIDNTKNTSKIVQKVPWGVYEGRSFAREVYEESMRIPFEMLSIPVPLKCDYMLKNKYGDYMRIIMGGGGHDYPYFKGQKESLGTEFDYPILYKFNEADINDNSKDYSGSIKQISAEIKEYLLEAATIIKEIIETSANNTPNFSDAEITGFLADVQDNVVQYGTLVEKVKGEGTSLVLQLEHLCEYLYNLADSHANLSLIDELIEISDGIISEIDLKIINRKTAAFFSYKKECFDSLKLLYDYYSQNEDYDVMVIDLPTYDKEYDGSFTMDGFDGPDMSLVCPDVIVTNYPYDEYNMAVTIPPCYYAKNIRKYTEKLIYIPYFVVADFEQNNYPCWHNMSYYCTVPGVVLADEVIINSEKMRDRYIEKLTGWSGEEYAGLWQKKIRVVDNFNVYSRNDNPYELNRNPKVDPCESKQNDKKTLIWFCSAASIFSYGDKYIDKMHRNLEVFKSKAEDINIVFMTEDYTEETLKLKNASLYDKFFLIKKEIGTVTNIDCCTFNLSDKLTVKIIDNADAYYGDGSIVCKDFILNKKPVMLQNIDV